MKFVYAAQYLSCPHRRKGDLGSIESQKIRKKASQLWSWLRMLCREAPLTTCLTTVRAGAAGNSGGMDVKKVIENGEKIIKIAQMTAIISLTVLEASGQELESPISDQHPRSNAPRGTFFDCKRPGTQTTLLWSGFMEKALFKKFWPFEMF